VLKEVEIIDNLINYLWVETARDQATVVLRRFKTKEKGNNSSEIRSLPIVGENYERLIAHLGGIKGLKKGRRVFPTTLPGTLNRAGQAHGAQ